MNGIDPFESVAFTRSHPPGTGKAGWVDGLRDARKARTICTSPFAMWCSGMSSGRLNREFADRQPCLATI